MASAGTQSAFPLRGLFGQVSENLMALALFLMVAILIVPLPGLMIDLLLACNLAITMMLLVITMSAKQPLDFSVFPSLLLILTLFRLTLNVATTRAILVNGEAGGIVRAFGDFVVQRNLLVGLVIFGILVVIQFVVVTKGAGRISEVAARFTLDAMPGKQMTIDAQLTAGAIDEAEARSRRKHLERESEFYAAMEGASKFVRGDAVAGLIITAINLVGGIITGWLHGMDILGAVQTYSVLTVGDSLVSQLPAFIISIAAGIIVTKSTSESNLGQELGMQFLGNTQSLVVGSIIIFALILLPGLPRIPLFFLGAAFWLLIWQVRRSDQRKQAQALSAAAAQTAEEAQQTPRPTSEVILNDFLSTDRVGIEIGAKLIPLVRADQPDGLTSEIMRLRRDVAKKNGIWIPAIRIRDNTTLDGEVYRILINGREAGKWTLRVGQKLALPPVNNEKPLFTIEGEATREPAYNLPALWIAPTDADRAKLAGYTVVEPMAGLVTHLGELARKHAPELLGREDLKQLVDKVRESSPSLVDELIPGVVSMGMLHRVLTLMLEERIPIINLTRILEALAIQPKNIVSPVELAERIRADIGEIICERFVDAERRIHAIIIDPRLEQEWKTAIRDKKELPLDVRRLEKLRNVVSNAWNKSILDGQEAALMTDSGLRLTLRELLVRAIPELGVIGYNEMPKDLNFFLKAMVRAEELA